MGTKDLRVTPSRWPWLERIAAQPHLSKDIMIRLILGRCPSGLCVIGPGTHEPCLDALHHSSVIVGYVELLRYFELCRRDVYASPLPYGRHILWLDNEVIRDTGYSSEPINEDYWHKGNRTKHSSPH